MTRFYDQARRSRWLALTLLLAVTGVWSLTRVRAYTELVQHRHQQVMAGFGVFLSAAMAPLRYFPWYGDRFAAGQYERLGDVFADFRPFRPAVFRPTDLVRTEKGLVVAIRVVCKYLSAPASAGTIVAMQLALDIFVLYGMCFLLWRWGGPIAAFAGGLYYASAWTAAGAATFPFYYYWPIPFGVVLCLMADRTVQRHGASRLALGAALGFVAGLWLLFRATAVLVPVAIAAALLAVRVPLRRLAPLILIVVLLQQLPTLLVVARAPRGEPARLGRSNLWHGLYLGIGTRPNPYGIEFNDSYAANMVARRYGIPFNGPGYEAALKREYFKILAADPSLIVRNTALNFVDAIRGWSFLESACRWLWLGALAGLLVALRRGSSNSLGFVLAVSLWVVQCATLGFVCRPQTSYLWETMAVAALAGFGGLGIALEWVLERVGWKSPELLTEGPERPSDAPVGTA